VGAENAEQTKNNKAIKPKLFKNVELSFIPICYAKSVPVVGRNNGQRWSLDIFNYYFLYLLE